VEYGPFVFTGEIAVPAIVQNVIAAKRYAQGFQVLFLSIFAASWARIAPTFGNSFEEIIVF